MWLSWILLSHHQRISAWTSFLHLRNFPLPAPLCPSGWLFGFFVRCVLLAESAVLACFHSVRMCLLILCCVVVTLLALCTCQCDSCTHGIPPPPFSLLTYIVSRKLLVLIHSLNADNRPWSTPSRAIDITGLFGILSIKKRPKSHLALWL